MQQAMISSTGIAKHHALGDLIDKRQRDEINIEQCANWLYHQGFRILGTETGLRNPRITIACCPLCEQLEGAVRMYERSQQGDRRYWVAIRFDVEVRWQEGGAA